MIGPSTSTQPSTMHDRPTARALFLATSFLIAQTATALAAPPTVDATTARDPDTGCTRITIKITPNGNGIQDVHLRVARTTHTAKGEATSSGDPMNGHYTGPNPPAGWTYDGVKENPIPQPPGAGPGAPQSSDWDATWTNPNAALPAGPSTFAVDYCGDKGDVAAAKGNIILTSNGQVNFDPKKDVVSKGDGFMPLPVAMAPIKPVKPVTEYPANPMQPVNRPHG